MRFAIWPDNGIPCERNWNSTLCLAECITSHDSSRRFYEIPAGRHWSPFEWNLSPVSSDDHRAGDSGQEWVFRGGEERVHRLQMQLGNIPSIPAPSLEKLDIRHQPETSWLKLFDSNEDEMRREHLFVVSCICVCPGFFDRNPIDITGIASQSKWHGITWQRSPLGIRLLNFSIWHLVSGWVIPMSISHPVSGWHARTVSWTTMRNIAVDGHRGFISIPSANFPFDRFPTVNE